MHQKTDALVYRDDIPSEGKLLIPTMSYPVDGETKDTYQSYSSEWITDESNIVASYNHEVQASRDSGIDIITQVFNQDKAQIVFKNNGAVDAVLRQFDIRADVLYEDGDGAITMPADAIRTEKIKLDYVHDYDDAEEFAECLYNNTILHGSYSYEFDSETDYQVGLMYELDCSYNVNVLIIR